VKKGQLQQSGIKLVSSLVYSTVDSGLTITYRPNWTQLSWTAFAFAPCPVQLKFNSV